MDKCVNFENAKLIKQKGFNEPVTRRYNYLGKLSKYTQFPENYNTEIWGNEISAPTIAKVVTWLLEKHKIWIEVVLGYNEKTTCFNYYINSLESGALSEDDETEFKTPEECYEDAIEYSLKNLI